MYICIYMPMYTLQKPVFKKYQKSVSPIFFKQLFTVVYATILV